MVNDLPEREAVMKNKIPQGFFLAAIVVLISIICVYGIITNNEKDYGKKIETNNVYSEFNSLEKKYIKENGNIDIYLDKDLQYLIKADGTGFLNDYLHSILSVAGIKFNFTDDLSESDCQLMVINDRIRDDNYNADYTAPLFQVDGALFFNTASEYKDKYSGIVIDGRIRDDDLKEITYNDSTIDFEKADTTDEAVAKALSENKDCIIGDRGAILDALNGDKSFIPEEESVYSCNTCIIVQQGNDALYGIINNCIYAADRQELSYKAGQKWLDGNGPRYMDDSYEDIYMLLLIIFAAVLIAFFIYYQANKNLYQELNDRMVKLNESKQELKTTFNGVGYYLAEIDLEGTILDINKAFYNFVNCETANRKVWDVVEFELKYKELIQCMLKDIEDGKEVHTIQVRLKKQTIDIDIFPIENARGSVEKLLFMAMDVTREKMAERQLLQDNKMIAVGQLAAGVAHEIRNPLGIIRNYCYVLKTMSDDSVKEKAIEQIEKSVDKSGAIINSLLNFSRVSSSNGETINVEEHIWSLIQLNYNILKKKNIDLEVICDEDIWTYLAVESLDMILINLISNATDAMSENGSLTIRVIRYQESFEIDVEDTGCGIEEDILQDIFNPFFTTKGNKKGNGLGLYIVYNEVNKLNGTIEVESKVGEGTKFKLILPLSEEESGKEKKND